MLIAVEIIVLVIIIVIIIVVILIIVIIIVIEIITVTIRLMDKILHYFKYPKLWELWYIPYYGSCRILSINRSNNNRDHNDRLPLLLDRLQCLSLPNLGSS